jgi:hypothetical protein
MKIEGFAVFRPFVYNSGDEYTFTGKLEECCRQVDQISIWLYLDSPALFKKKNIFATYLMRGLK